MNPATTDSPSTPDRCCVSLADKDLLSSCVHCGFCLEVCPTYKLTGDENNSPRGRLRLWREEAEGRLEVDPWTDFYTSECVGCLACETACPANVPYGEIFEQIRHDHVATGLCAAESLTPPRRSSDRPPGSVQPRPAAGPAAADAGPLPAPQRLRG